MIERTEGNPLFLEECARTLAETHVLVGERGSYRLTGELSTIQVARTVQRWLAARIDRLPERFEPVPGRHRQISETHRRVQILQLPFDAPPEFRREPPGPGELTSS